MPRGGARSRSGPVPKPASEKIREGTHKKRDGPPEGVRPANGKRPPMPTGLSATAKTAWKNLVDDLQASALLDSADAALYEAFAVQFSRAREARRLIDRHGMLVPGAREGQLVANPMIRVEREALKAVQSLAAELAIGMGTRARLGLALARGGGAVRTGDEANAPNDAGADIGPSPRLQLVSGRATS